MVRCFQDRTALWRIVRSGAACSALAWIVAPPASAQGIPSDSLRSALVAIARGAVAAEQNAFVGGVAASAIASSGLAPRNQGAVQARVDHALQVRSRVMATRHRYTSHSDSLIVGDIKLSGDTARLYAAVRVTYAHSTTDGDALAPRSVGRQDPYEFTFVRQGGVWTLTNSRQRELDAHRETKGPAASGTPLTRRSGAGSRNTRPPRPANAPARRPSGPSAWDWNQAAGMPDGGPVEWSGGATDVYYDWQAAIDYARHWAYDRNPAYPDMRNFWDFSGVGDDCTNFLSQILYNGNWEMTSGDKASYASWFLNGSSGSWSWSDSWSIADTWHLMALHLSRVTGVNYWDQLTIADVVQMDWGPSPDSRLDHAMFITSIDAAGEIYLTGHSNDRLDYPLSTVQADSDPATIYYGWHVKDYYPYPFP